MFASNVFYIYSNSRVANYLSSFYERIAYGRTTGKINFILCYFKVHKYFFVLCILDFTVCEVAAIRGFPK